MAEPKAHKHTCERLAFCWKIDSRKFAHTNIHSVCLEGAWCVSRGVHLTKLHLKLEPKTFPRQPPPPSQILFNQILAVTSELLILMLVQRVALEQHSQACKCGLSSSRAILIRRLITFALGKLRIILPRQSTTRLYRPAGVRVCVLVYFG